ncbi:MAG: hypothetical protein MJ196_11585 [Treponemataceae bacterium]|nr:hypothetical protein [Treponemataceae bacterium]
MKKSSLPGKTHKNTKCTNILHFYSNFLNPVTAAQLLISFANNGLAAFLTMLQNLPLSLKPEARKIKAKNQMLALMQKLQQDSKIYMNAIYCKKMQDKNYRRRTYVPKSRT